MAAPGSHVQTIAGCAQFGQSHPADPLLPVVQAIQAWHLLQEGKVDEAAGILRRHLGAAEDDPVTAAARRIAQAWMTRIDRGRVVRALDLFYRKEVAYPASLAEIGAHPGIPRADQPPMTDAFGAPWNYRLTGFKGMAGFENQRYSLQSATLGETSDIAVARKIPYAAGIQAVPERVTGDTPPMVMMRSGAQAGLVAPGQNIGGISVVFVGRKILVLADHSYWKVLSRP